MKQAEFDGLSSNGAKLEFLLDRQFQNELESAFTVVVDVPPEVDANNISDYELTVDLSNLLKGSTAYPYTGKNVAEEMTREVNKQFGGQAYFDLSEDNANFGKFTVESTAVSGLGDADSIDIDVAEALNATGDSLSQLTWGTALSGVWHIQFHVPSCLILADCYLRPDESSCLTG